MAATAISASQALEAGERIEIRGFGSFSLHYREPRRGRNPKTGDAVESGDKIEIVLTITSKNTYDYLVFEDMKAAGFEPVQVRSGYGGNDMGAYMELRDEKVVFFTDALETGKHVITYAMRAEVPGRFHAMPTKAYAMYAPVRYKDSAEGLWIGGQFWDSGATGEVLGDPLADQALGPFLNPVEMANQRKVQVSSKSLTSLRH